MSKRSQAQLTLLLSMFICSLPAVGQPCKYENIEDATMATFANRVTGTGGTLIDVFSRLLAQIDSVDLDSNDTSTILTWNIDKYWSAKASIENQPKLLRALEEAIGDNSDLLSQLTDRVGRGDDWQVSLHYNFQNESMNLGSRAVANKVTRAMKGNWNAAKNGGGWHASIAAALDEQPCPATTRYFEGMMPFVAMQAAKEKPKELMLSAYFKSRDELVGQDEIGGGISYTHGFADGEAKTARGANGAVAAGAEDRGLNLMKAAMLVGAASAAGFSDQVVNKRFGPAVVEARSELTSARQRVSGESAEAQLADVQTKLAQAELRLAQGKTDLGERIAAANQLLQAARDQTPAVIDHRLTISANWKQIDEYNYATGLDNPVNIPESEIIDVDLKWSFQFKRDGKNLAQLPRFELSVCYEDVDDASARQSRLIARAIATQKLDFMGENTELTAGLVYANKPEYLADEEFDEQLSANLGLTFKLGKAN